MSLPFKHFAFVTNLYIEQAARKYCLEVSDMSKMEQIEINALIHRDKAKAARLLYEHGYSVRTISRFLDLPENNVRFMVRRE